MPQLLFEIGVEELPALSIEPAMEFMASYMQEALLKARLLHTPVEVLATPRRLVIMIEDLALSQEQISEEILGPRADIAFSEHGLSDAAFGFIKAKNISPSAVYKKKTDKGEFLAASVTTLGLNASEILPELLINLLRAIPFKKRMRWENSGESFARPVRRLLCLFGNTYLDFRFADVASGKNSAGHRFLAPEEFLVTSISHYKTEMAKRFVILSPKEREAIFIKAAQEKLQRFDARFTNDPELMATARNLMEYPFAIVGTFEDRYLSIPKEILICEMKTHQKSFAVLRPNGELLPYFVCTAGTKPFDEDFFAQGNARVLRARFEDGAYYFAEDKKIPLREHAKKLDKLIFERDLGTYAQKSQRIEKLALALAYELNLKGEVDLIKDAAPLVKADLLSGVVGQFPELQGVMGRIYADLDGESQALCEIIETHYWPRFAEDSLPRLSSAALLSIADKLDTLVGIIALNKKPKGNKDPFGLRRSAIAIVRMLVSFGLSITLEKLVSLALSGYEQFKSDSQTLIIEISDFIMQRARGLLNDEMDSRFVDGVFAVGSTNVVDAFARAHVLFHLHKKNLSEFESLSQAFKRASNIVKKANQSGEIYNLSISDCETFLKESCEKNLVNAVRQTQALINKVSDNDDMKTHYEELFAHVALLKPALDAFFEGVMVMVDDKPLRHARLALLNEIKHIADKIADFTHL
jgi:glycyl-tRNA synthetase beta chain